MRRPSPWPWLTLGGGAIALFAGAASTTLGLMPAIAHEAASADVEAAEASISDNPAGALDAARAAQARQAQAASDWGTWGVPLVVAGAICGGLGAVGLGAGGWLVLTEAE